MSGCFFIAYHCPILYIQHMSEQWVSLLPGESVDVIRFVTERDSAFIQRIFACYPVSQSTRLHMRDALNINVGHTTVNPRELMK